MLPYVVFKYGLDSHLDSRTIIGQVFWYSLFADECTKTMSDILVVCFVHMVYISKPTLMDIDLCYGITPQIIALTPYCVGGVFYF